MNETTEATPKRRTIAAEAAASIRKELKEAGIKVDSVKSKTFAGGDSVNISITDAPPAVYRTAREIASRHELGTFDGMEDIYRYRPDDSGRPRAKYVHVNNQMSPQMRERIHTFLMDTQTDYAENPEGHPQRDYIYWTFCASREWLHPFWSEEDLGVEL